MGALPSITPMENREPSEPFMTAEEARNILATSLDGRPLKIKDKTRFRYVMFRAPKDTEFLKTVLKLLPRYPEHIDAFVAYFTNFERRDAIVRAALDYLRDGIPYSHVRGELWHVVARLAGPKELQKSLPMAHQDARDRARCVSLSWGVMHFLMRCEEKGLARIGRRLSKEHETSRSLLAPIFRDKEFSSKGHAAALLRGKFMEQLAGARELQKRKITLNSLGLRQRDLPPSCNTALLSLGAIRRRHRTDKDYIREVLVRLYECNHSPIWPGLLGSEYEHALQILIEAEARFPGARSDWLALQDSFNDLVVRQFFEFLKNKSLNGHSKIVDRNGQLVRYGSLITAGSPFDTAYPSEAKMFRTMHDRRNGLPGSHPYSQKGGARNKWLDKNERDSFVSELKNTLDSIAAVVAQNS